MSEQTYDTATVVEEQKRTAPELAIYVAEHCEICDFAREMAKLIQERFPQIDVRIVDIAKEPDQVPALVFATPTYVLDGYVWSLGNPSLEKVEETFGQPISS